MTMNNETPPLDLAHLKALYDAIEQKVISKDIDFHVSSEEGDRITDFWVSLHNTFPQLCRELEAAKKALSAEVVSKNTAVNKWVARLEEAESQLSKAEEEKTRLINDLTALQTECDGLRITRAEFKKKVTDVGEERDRMQDGLVRILNLAVVNEPLGMFYTCQQIAEESLFLQPIPQTEGREDALPKRPQARVHGISEHKHCTMCSPWKRQWQDESYKAPAPVSEKLEVCPYCKGTGHFSSGSGSGEDCPFCEVRLSTTQPSVGREDSTLTTKPPTGES
jgi:hypothetical protein